MGFLSDKDRGAIERWEQSMTPQQLKAHNDLMEEQEYQRQMAEMRREAMDEMNAKAIRDDNRGMKPTFAQGMKDNGSPKVVAHKHPGANGSREISIRIENLPSEQAEAILFDLLPDWITEFMRKNADYGDASEHLGAAGQYAELWRKVGKLKGPLWDDRGLNYEQSDEIVRDLIGHCFLTLLFLKKGNNR